MKNTMLVILAMFSGLSFGGCVNSNPKLAQADGFGEFVTALGGYGKTDLYPVEKISAGSGKIATGHARQDAQGVYVTGYVEKRGPGWVTAASSHVDVVVLNSKERPLQKVATKFFPSEVPATQRGITGRSRYFVRLSSTPPAGSIVQVAFHQKPISQCEFGQKS